MAGELEERQESPAPQPEPRAAVVETPSPVMMSAEPAAMMATAATDTAEDQYFSQADALRKNPQFQSRSYGMDDEAPQAKSDNGLSGHSAPKKLRADEIALGASQNNGAQTIRANLMTSKDTQASAIQAQHDRARAAEMRIAQWNATMTMVGGVQMTNEQAQNSRLNIVQNGDKYADWAVKKGLIKEEDKEKFKQTAKEMYELKEKEKNRGYATPEEQKKFTELQTSVAGHAVELATAESHNIKINKLDTDAALKNSAETGKPIAVESNLKDMVVIPPDPIQSKKTGSAASLVSSNGLSDQIDLVGSFTPVAQGITPVVSQAPAPADIKIARVAGASGPT